MINPGRLQPYLGRAASMRCYLRSLPVIEVHISNIHRREQFRHHSYVSTMATGVLCGFGTHGYALALTAMARLLEDRSMSRLSFEPEDIRELAAILDETGPDRDRDSGEGSPHPHRADAAAHRFRYAPMHPWLPAPAACSGRLSRARRRPCPW